MRMLLYNTHAYFCNYSFMFKSAELLPCRKVLFSSLH